MLVKKSRPMAAKKEMTVKGDRFIIDGVDVTEIVAKHAPDFVSVMGEVGKKEYHNYYGLSENVWKKITGVTSVLDCVGDKSQLQQWAVNMAMAEFGWLKQIKDEPTSDYKSRLRKSVQEALVKFQALSFEQVIEFINDARLAHARYTRKTANLGKKVHAEIENIIKMSIEFHKGKVQHQIASMPQVQHFIEWAIKNDVTFLASEYKVFSRKMWVAGTCDLVMKIDDVMYIGDIKTTTYIWGRSYFAQCAAYRMCLEEMYPGQYSFGGSILLRIGRDGEFNPEEDVHLSTYYEDDKKFFLSALEIYRQENNMYE